MSQFQFFGQGKMTGYFFVFAFFVTFFFRERNDRLLLELCIFFLQNSTEHSWVIYNVCVCVCVCVCVKERERERERVVVVVVVVEDGFAKPNFRY